MGGAGAALAQILRDAARAFVLRCEGSIVYARNRTKPARARKDPLKDYAGKRDFSRTAEPKPQAPPKRRGKPAGLQFVVQKHAARRTHYDLRLELDGVLKSRAVTRGPRPGGGAMIVWDRGTWTPDGDPHRGLDKGHLQFALEGARLKGHWHLVRIRPRQGERTDPWLLITSEDAFARPAGAGG